MNVTGKSSLKRAFGLAVKRALVTLKMAMPVTLSASRAVFCILAITNQSIKCKKISICKSNNYDSTLRHNFNQ